MIKVISLGRMELGLYETRDIIGTIEKIKIRYGKPEAEDMVVSLKTSDGETLIEAQGAKDTLFYPRNWNLANEAYTGINIAAEGQSVMNAEKYLSTGKLQIIIEGSEGDYIESITIVADVQEQQEIVIKEEGQVSTNTAGAYNATHDRRRRMLSQLTSKIWASKEFIDKADELHKADPNDIRRYIEENLYTRKFDGITQKVSEQIKDFILRAIVKNYHKDRIMKYLAYKGVDPKQSNLIYRTESQALKTKLREWSYQKIDPEGELKYKWLGPMDERTTSTCKAIASRTSEGTTLAQLKQIIQEEVENAKGRGELPKDYDAREYTPHFQCRHTFIRAY